MAGIKVNLFGQFEVRRGEDLIGRREWGRQKARSLLKLLLTRPGHAFSRDEILEFLWPGVSPQRAEQSLRVTVSRLRKVLEPDLERGSDARYLLSRRPGYLFDRQTDCWVDAWEFEERRKSAEAAREAGNLDEAIDEYRLALELARGEFLAEEPYEEWAMEARHEWRERHLAVLSSLAECLALRGLYGEAIGACNRALALDGYREDLHRGLILYHYCAGEQALALRAYRDYARKLREELDTVPSPELTRLEAQVEARDVPGVDEMRRYPMPRRPLRFPYSLSRTRLVGRDREYAWLAERLEEAVEGTGGGAVAVEGEAGIGKTRLVEEFLGYARSRGVRVLSGRCYERELGPPLEPVMDALDPLPATGELVSGVLPPGGEGFPISQSGAEESDFLRGSEPYRNTRIYWALVKELIRESHNDDHEGLVLFVDDAQWADPATLDFLAYLARRVSGERILVVFTYRREDAPGLSGWLDALAERRTVSTLSPGRLSLEDTKELLGSMSSRSFGGLPSLANFLYGESEGNPFYVVEYLRWLIEAGVVRIDPRRRIGGLKSEALQERTLPSGVQALIRARLNGMDEETRGLLELAAVIGRTFDLRLLCGADARGETETYATIEPLVDSGLIVGTVGKYCFSHDKLRQALYEGINGPRLRELHLRVAGTLEETGSEAAELGHHYLRAEAWRPALENLVLAGRKAEESEAWETALENYARALEIVGKLPESEETRFELLAWRERLLERTERHEERAEAVREMFEFANRLGDQTRIAEVHVRRIGVLVALSDPVGAAEAGHEAVAIFRKQGDKAGEARVHREVGYVLFMNRDYAGALEANFRALEIHRELGNPRGEASGAGNIAGAYLGMEDHENALRWNEESVRIYHKLGDKLGEVLRMKTMADIHLRRGELETALSLSLKTLRLHKEFGAKMMNIPLHSTCGTLYLRLGDPQESLEHFRAAARISREIGYARKEGYSLMSVGIALEQVGNPAGAAEAHRRAVELLATAYEESGMVEELSVKADALTLLGRLLHHSLEKPEEALDAYEEAADIYRRLADPHRLRRLLMNMAGLCWRTGDPKSSARHYEEALQLARQHGEAAHGAAALMSLSVVHRDLGNLKESVRCGREALELLRSVQNLQAEAYLLSSLAESHLGLGQQPSALSCLKRSLRLRRKIGDEEGEVGVLHDLARVYEDMGDADFARKARNEAASTEGTSGEARRAVPIVERRS